MGGPRRYGLAMWAVRLGVRMAKYLPWHPGQAGRLDPRPRVAQGSRRIPSAVGGSSGPMSTIAERQAMSSRDIILQRIRSGLTNAVAAGFGDLREPPVPEVWPRTNPEPAALAVPVPARSLEVLKGEAILARRWPMPADSLPELMETAPWARIGSLDRPLDAGTHGRASRRSRRLGDVRLDTAADRAASGRADHGRRLAGRHRLVRRRIARRPRSG